jgi:hypothetical protein
MTKIGVDAARIGVTKALRPPTPVIISLIPK